MSTILKHLVLLMGLIIFLIMSIQFFVLLSMDAAKYIHGGTRDSGILPKRPFNVDAYYLPPFPPQGSTGPDQKVAESYPIEVLAPGNPLVKLTRRIKIARTTNCPIFRKTDDGKNLLIS